MSSAQMRSHSDLSAMGQRPITCASQHRVAEPETLTSRIPVPRQSPRKLRRGQICLPIAYCCTRTASFVMLILLGQTVCNPACRAVEAPASGAADSEVVQTARLIQELDSDKYAVREMAMDQLRDIGRAAVDPLVSAACRGNPEVGWRAVVTLHLISQDLDLQTQDAAFDALERLVDQAPKTVSQQAARILRIPGHDRHHRAVIRLRQLGGSVAHGYHKPTTVRLDENWIGGDDGLIHLTRLERLTEVKLEDSPVKDAGLAHLAELHTITRLYLGNSRVRGPGLKHVARMQGLKYLSLRGLELEEGALEHLRHVREIEYLGLDETNVSDEDLQYLENMSKLRRLWLNKTKISGKGLQHLQKLPRLTTLYLSHTGINGPAIEQLQKIRSLRYLSFQHVPLKDSDAKYLSKLDQITTLGIDDTLIGDRGIKQLQGLKNLQTLWLNNTRTSDDSIESLKRLSRLQRLYLAGTRVTASGIKELLRVLPNCQVTK